MSGGETAAKQPRDEASLAFVRALPPRHPHSLRRTSSLSTAWPQGIGQPFSITARGRDLVTGRDGDAAFVANEDWLNATLSARREILALTTSAKPDIDAAILGKSALGGFRKVITPFVARSDSADRPLGLLLDDLVGVSVVSFGVEARLGGGAETRIPASQRENVCYGFSTGFSAMSLEEPTLKIDKIGDSWASGDAHAFHAMPARQAMTWQRIRRLDIWLDDSETLKIDTMFQDSVVLPDLSRVAFHEYRLEATASLENTQPVLTGLSAVSGNLPYAECHAAPGNLSRLIGRNLVDLRKSVLESLRGAEGCTHLNDAMRSLSAVPALLPYLQKSLPDQS